MQTVERIRKMIAEVSDIPESSIPSDSAPLTEQLDPLDFEDLILAVEEEFDLLIEDESRVRTLADLVKAVEANMAVA
ncbi:MAG: acyl carrier protein [Bacillota bacterium]